MPDNLPIQLTSFVGRGERFDYGQQMVVVIRQPQLDGPEMIRIAGNSQRGFVPVSVGFDERLKAETFQALRHGTAVPP